MFFSIFVAVDSNIDLIDRASLLSSLFCAGVNVDEESFFSVGSTELMPPSFPTGTTFSTRLSPVSFFSARRAARVVVEEVPGAVTGVIADGSEIPAVPGMVDETAAETAVAVVAAAMAVLLITVATISSWTLIIFVLFGGCCTVAVVPVVVALEDNAGGMLGRCWVGCAGAAVVDTAGLGLSSGAKCVGLEITGVGTSLTGVTGGALVDGPAGAEPMGKSLSTSVSRMMVLTAYLTALFSALAMMAAAVP